jgi:hypothetical protein
LPEREWPPDAGICLTDTTADAEAEPDTGASAESSAESAQAGVDAR